MPKNTSAKSESRSDGTASATLGALEPAARWVEPAIEDHAAFALAHPETVVTAEIWAKIEPEIRRRARMLEWDAERRTDVEAEIRLRIIEAARGYRALDDQGQPIFDYLVQSNGYIVQHAAGRVYSALRRERREAGTTVLLGALADGRTDREDGGEGPAILDPADPRPSDPLEHASEDELYHAVALRLTRTQLRIFRLMREGWDRAQIGQMVGLSRSSVHDHVSAIRQDTLEVLKERGDRVALAEVGSLSTYRRKS